MKPSYVAPYVQRTYKPPPTVYAQRIVYPNNITYNSTYITECIGHLQSGNYGMIDEFIKSNVIPLSVVKDDNQNSPLHLILELNTLLYTEQQLYDICNLLITNGALINTYNINGETPIHLATKQNYNSILKLLLDNGGNANSTNNMQQNALHLAVKPNIKLCPSFIPESLIPQTETNMQSQRNEINTIIANELFAINFKTTNKNIIDSIVNILNNSHKYIENSIINDDADDNKITSAIFKQKLYAIYNDLQSIYKDNTFTQTDRQFKLKQKYTTHVAEIHTLLQQFYSKIHLENNLFLSNDIDDYKTVIYPQSFYNIDPTVSTIYKYNTLNYKQHLDTLFQDINDNLTTNLKNLLTTVSNCVDIWEHIQSNISFIHYLTYCMSYSTYTNTAAFDAFKVTLLPPKTLPKLYQSIPFEIKLAADTQDVNGKHNNDYTDFTQVLFNKYNIAFTNNYLNTAPINNVKLFVSIFNIINVDNLNNLQKLFKYMLSKADHVTNGRTIPVKPAAPVPVAPVVPVRPTAVGMLWRRLVSLVAPVAPVVPVPLAPVAPVVRAKPVYPDDNVVVFYCTKKNILIKLETPNHLYKLLHNKDFKINIQPDKISFTWELKYNNAKGKGIKKIDINFVLSTFEHILSVSNSVLIEQYIEIEKNTYVPKVNKTNIPRSLRYVKCIISILHQQNTIMNNTSILYNYMTSLQCIKKEKYINKITSLLQAKTIDYYNIYTTIYEFNYTFELHFNKLAFIYKNEINNGFNINNYTTEFQSNTLNNTFNTLTRLIDNVLLKIPIHNNCQTIVKYLNIHQAVVVQNTYLKNLYSVPNTITSYKNIVDNTELLYQVKGVFNNMMPLLHKIENINSISTFGTKIELSLLSKVPTNFTYYIYNMIGPIPFQTVSTPNIDMDNSTCSVKNNFVKTTKATTEQISFIDSSELPLYILNNTKLIDTKDFDILNILKYNLIANAINQIYNNKHAEISKILQTTPFLRDNAYLKMTIIKIIAETVNMIINKNIDNYLHKLAKNIFDNLFLPTPTSMPSTDLLIDFKIDLKSVVTPLYFKQKIDNPIHDNTYTYGGNTYSIYYNTDDTNLDNSILNKKMLKCIIRNTSILDTLFNTNIQIHQHDISHKTPIMYAIDTNNIGIIDKLLERVHSNIHFNISSNKNLIQYSIDNALKSISNYDNYITKYDEMLNKIFLTNSEFKKNMPINFKKILILAINLFNVQINNNLTPANLNTAVTAIINITMLSNVDVLTNNIALLESMNTIVTIRNVNNISKVNNKTLITQASAYGTMYTNINNINNLLLTRYDNKNNMKDNIILRYIAHSITYATILDINDIYIKSITELLNKFKLDPTIINKIITELTNGPLYMTFDFQNPNKQEITYQIVMLLLDAKFNETDRENKEYKTINNIIESIKHILTKYTNDEFIQIYETHIESYYIILYRTIIEHLIILLTNYIKSISHQRNAMYIVNAILTKYKKINNL